MDFRRTDTEAETVSGIPFTLEGKTALVTGAGRGIGRAIAKRLIGAGARVMINDLDEKMLLESEAELARPGRVSHITGDLTDPAIPELIVNATLAEFDSIDIIVNNAGYSWDNVIQKTTDEQFQAMLDIHLLTPFRILRAASGFIRESAKKEIAASQRVMRKVVNITSIAGLTGIPGRLVTLQARRESSASRRHWPRSGGDITST